MTAHQWQPIATAPRDEAFRLYGLNVRHRNGHQWFEVHYVALVDGDLIHPSGDCFSDWHYDDFEFWADAPAWPAHSTTGDRE